MAKKQKRYVITSEQIFDAQKPQWNGWGCGYGPHSDRKYNRTKSKRAWKREVENYG